MFGESPAVGILLKEGLVASADVDFLKQLRETRLVVASSSIRKCGSRAVTALVGCGAKPRRSPFRGLRS